VESEVEGSRARLGLASERVRMAALRYNDLGPSLKEAEHLSIEMGQFAAMNSALNLGSPITGTVITPKFKMRWEPTCLPVKSYWRLRIFPIKGADLRFGMGSE